MTFKEKTWKIFTEMVWWCWKGFKNTKDYKLENIKHTIDSGGRNLLERFWLILNCNNKWNFFVKLEHAFLLSSNIRRKYCISENFRHLFFDRFTCFQMSWTRFDRFLENVCMNVCLLNFVDIASQELMHGNWWKFLLSCTLI